MATFRVKLHDTTLPLTVDTDLTGASVKAFIRSARAEGEVPAVVPVNVTDAVVGAFDLVLAEVGSGEFDLEVLVEKGGEQVRTPSVGFDRLVIGPNLDDPLAAPYEPSATLEQVIGAAVVTEVERVVPETTSAAVAQSITVDGPAKDALSTTIGAVAAPRYSPTVEASEDVPAMLGRRALRLLSRDASGALTDLQRTVVDVITNQGNGYTAFNLYPTLAESRIKLSFWMDPTETGTARERPLSIETHGNTENGEYDVSFYTQGPEGYSTSRKAFQWHWGPEWDGKLEFDMALFVKASDVNPTTLTGAGAYLGMFPAGVDQGQPWLVLHHGDTNRPWLVDNRGGTLRFRTKDTTVGASYATQIEMVASRVTFQAGVNVTTGGATNAGGGAGVFALRNASTIPTTTVSDTAVLYTDAGVPKVRGGTGAVASLVMASRPQYTLTGAPSTQQLALNVTTPTVQNLADVLASLIQNLAAQGSAIRAN